MKKLAKALASIMLMTAVVFAAGCKKDNADDGNVNGHTYVDLGLPSGTLWATCNVGSTTPEGYGDYFAWGETEPKTIYGWNSYKYATGEYQLTKYCNDSGFGYNGFTDNLTVLQSADDAATANWGSGWCMPTADQWRELRDNTSITRATQKGVNGWLFTAPNGNSLFLPAAGYRWGIQVDHVGSDGFYWSSSLYTDYPSRAWYFNSIDWAVSYDRRDYGRSVRAVLSGHYSIDATSSPAEGGTIAGGGIYTAGAECTLTATANESYSFMNWTENGEVVSPHATYSFTVDASRTLVANFNLDHAYVDLGLPSGLLWATSNVGATTLEDYGDYFAWGETQPKDMYDWITYQYCNDSFDSLTKYCSESSFGYNGFTDDLTTLLPEDDAATANWGDDWRMPTESEWQELYQNTTVSWTTRNGIHGRLFTASNGTSLFLPAAGCQWDDELIYIGSIGNYWSSTLCTDYPSEARNISFGSDNCFMGCDRRGDGRPVRAVRSVR